MRNIIIPTKGRIRFLKTNGPISTQVAPGRWRGVPMNMVRLWTIALNMRRWR